MGLGTLCRLFGKTRQSYYQGLRQKEKTSIAQMIVLVLVKEIREEMPRLGTRKLQYLLTSRLKEHGIKMGRDQLFNLLRFHGLLIRRRRRTARTTNSHHWLKKYPNLIQEIIVTASEQLWVSDITYVRVRDGFSYLSLIMDAYSRKIMGYALHPTLEAIGCLKALKMAIRNRGYKDPFVLIHHSDRGVQYCSSAYVDILTGERIAISMTQDSNPCENSLAERVNGIIKNEFKRKDIYKSHKIACKAIEKDITIYNKKRPHGSLDYLTPEVAHSCQGPLKKRWKTYRRRERLSDQIKEISAPAIGLNPNL